MGNSQVMPKVDFKKEATKISRMYGRFFEGKNLERYTFAEAELRRKRVIFGCTSLFVIGVYTYTIIKIKQESFLDDFEEPKTVSRK